MRAKKIEKFLSKLTFTEKDKIYRKLWESYVEEDIRSHAEDMKLQLTNEQVSNAVFDYVYNGRYDCTLDYWSNIENVIERNS